MTGRGGGMSEILINWGLHIAVTLIGAALWIAMIVLWNLYQDQRSTIALHTGILAEREKRITTIEVKEDALENALVDLKKEHSEQEKLLHQLAGDVRELRGPYTKPGR